MEVLFLVGRFSGSSGSSLGCFSFQASRNQVLHLTHLSPSSKLLSGTESESSFIMSCVQLRTLATSPHPGSSELEPNECVLSARSLSIRKASGGRMCSWSWILTCRGENTGCLYPWEKTCSQGNGCDFQSKSTSTIAISAQSEQGVKSDTQRARHGVLKPVLSAKSGDPVSS